MKSGRQRLSSLLIVTGMVLGNSLWPAAPTAPATPPAATYTPDEGLLFAHVYFADRDDLSRLAKKLDLLESVNHQERYVAALLRPEEYQALLAAGYRVEVDPGKTALLNQPLRYLPGQTSGIPSYPCYRTVEETYAAMGQLAADHPELAAWIDIGDSWEKATPGGAEGYDLHVLVLTNADVPGPKPIFFLMAAIHAREYVTAELAARYAEYLVASYGVDPDVTWLLDHFEVHILPQANPDGRKLAEQAYYQRKNTNNTNGGTCSDPPGSGNQYGTDLNRNSSFHWGGDSSDPCAPTYQGPAAVSEPETQAIQAYVASIFPDQRGPGDADPAPAESTGVFITLHSYSELVLFPWGWTAGAAPNHLQLQTLGRKFGYVNGYTVCQSTCLYGTTGTTDDWAYGELGVAGYTFELGTSFFQGCTDFENTILPGNQPALTYAFKAARRPYQAPAGPDTLSVAVPVSSVVAGTPVTLTAVADDTRYAGPEAMQNIAAARFTVDAPAWITGTQTYDLAPADGAFDSPVEMVEAVVDTTYWARGRHLLIVESQDAAGVWGMASAVFLSIQTPTIFFPSILQP